MFPHATWNKFDAFLEGKTTTNNAAEAWNKAWNTRMEANASFWSTLDGFKREEALASQKWRENVISTRDQPPSPDEGTSRQIRQREKLSKIQNVLSKENVLPQIEYLSLLASLLQEI